MKKWRASMVLFVSGCLLAVVFFALHLAGLREHTTVLSGNLSGTSSTLAVVYIVSWFAFVLGTPILLIAALVQTVLERWFRNNR